MSLKQELSAVKDENASLKEKNQKLQTSLENLNEQLVKPNKMLFGRKSEKLKYFDDDQLCFFNEAELEYDKGAKEPTQETILIKAHERKPKRTKEEILGSLEHREVLIELEESEKICGKCSTPLYRIEQYWKSRGVDLNRNTLANWVIRGSFRFKPVIEYLNRMFLNLKVAHTDETGFNVLKRDGTHMNKRSTMWVRVSGKHEKFQFALYNYMQNKPQTAADELLSKFKGCLTSDGYEVYNNLFRCTHTGCYAHGRRKFLDAIPKGKKEGKAYEAFELINKMYDLERNTQESTSSLEEIKLHRQEKIKPVLEALLSHLEKTNPLPGSHLETAVNYVLNRKDQLSVFIDNPEVAIDNNRAERAVKLFVIGRKNWLFSDTDKGADSSSLCYSIIQSARLNDLDVYGYLIYLLTELPKLGSQPCETDLRKMLPWCTLPEYCKVKTSQN